MRKVLWQWDVHIVREVRLQNRSQQEPGFGKSLRGLQISSSCSNPGSERSHGIAISFLLVLSVLGYSSHLQDTATLSTKMLPSTLWPDKTCVSNNTGLETAHFPLKGPRAHSHALLAWVSSGRQRTVMINPSICSSPPPDTANVPQCLVQYTSSVVWGPVASPGNTSERQILRTPTQTSCIRNSGRGAQKSVF